jgi:hypothetical protein
MKLIIKEVINELRPLDKSTSKIPANPCPAGR